MVHLRTKIKPFFVYERESYFNLFIKFWKKKKLYSVIVYFILDEANSSFAGSPVAKCRLWFPL
jgi:hypothetical protein